MSERRRRKKKGSQEHSILTLLGQHRRALVYASLLLAAVFVLIGVTRGGGSSTTTAGDNFLNGLSPEVRELYQYALDRPDVLAYIPCYCGCEDIEHRSNLDCFVTGYEQGKPVFETHGYS